MAVVLLGARSDNRIGTSSDTKPTAGIAIGSFLLETDTGIWWTYTGSTWVQYPYIMR